ncbi:MAG: host-nuclease inhibitor Gam family protein [Pelagibacterales bacterium]|nr:host-nuclease inhibitor Gam family protein [Pelagibacterales bacterium]
MDGYFDVLLEEVQEAKTLADVDYILGKVSTFDAEIEEIEQSAETQINRINEWKELRINSIEKQKEYYIPSLHAFIQQSGKRTIKLVNGNINLRKRQPKLEIVDEEIIPNQFIKIREVSTIDKSGIKAHIKSTGEIPEGVDYVEQDDKFGYKLK